MRKGIPFVTIIIVAGVGFAAGLAGSLLGGYECELLGRKVCLMSKNAMVFAALLLMGLAPSVTYLMIGRTVHGYCGGALMGAVPVYVSEICQPQIRGTMAGTLGAFYCLGTTSVFTMGAALNWRHLLLACSAFPLTNFIMLLFATESPTWYLLRNRSEDALKTLKTLRGDPQVAQSEHDSLVENFVKRQECAVQTKDVPKWKRIWDMAREPTFLLPMASVMLIKVFGAHLAGMAPLFLYLNKMLIEIKVPGDPYWIGAGLMIFRSITSLFGPFLIKLFRKKVLFTICASLIVTGNIILGVSIQYDLPRLLNVQDNLVVFKWLPVAGICLMYIGLGFGQFNIVMSWQGELLPSYGRAVGGGLLGVIDGLVLFSVGKFLPSVSHAIGLGHIFLICACLCFCLILFVWFMVPETKGLSLEDVEEYYRVRCYGNKVEPAPPQNFDRLSLYDNVSIWGEELNADKKQERQSHQHYTS